MSNEARTPNGLIVSAEDVKHALTAEQQREFHNQLVDTCELVKACQSMGFGVCTGDVPEGFNGLVLMPPEFIPFYEAFLMNKIERLPEPETKAVVVP